MGCKPNSKESHPVTAKAPEVEPVQTTELKLDVPVPDYQTAGNSVTYNEPMDNAFQADPSAFREIPEVEAEQPPGDSLTQDPPVRAPDQNLQPKLNPININTNSSLKEEELEQVFGQEVVQAEVRSQEDYMNSPTNIPNRKDLPIIEIVDDAEDSLNRYPHQNQVPKVMSQDSIELSPPQVRVQLSPKLMDDPFMPKPQPISVNDYDFANDTYGGSNPSPKPYQNVNVNDLIEDLMDIQ